MVNTLANALGKGLGLDQWHVIKIAGGLAMAAVLLTWMIAGAYSGENARADDIGSGVGP